MTVTAPEASALVWDEGINKVLVNKEVITVAVDQGISSGESHSSSNITSNGGDNDSTTTDKSSIMMKQAAVAVN
jgi:hypothetical protein